MLFRSLFKLLCTMNKTCILCSVGNEHKIFITLHKLPDLFYKFR